MVDLESLRCFRAAAKHLNFRSAAAAVSLSPSAFSARIRLLEEELDAELFERTTRRVRLTPAGERLVPVAETCLNAAEQCQRTVSAATEDPPYRLLVGTRFELGLSWVLPALDGLRERAPARRLDLAFSDGPDLLQRLRRGRIDALISSSRLVDPDIVYAPLHEERYVLVAAPDLVDRNDEDAYSSEAIQKQPLVDIDSSMPLFRYLLDVLPPEESWAFPEVSHMGTIAAIRLRVVARAGVAVLPRYFVTNDLREGRLVELLPHLEPRRDWFRLIWLKGHQREQELQTLAKQLRALPLR